MKPLTMHQAVETTGWSQRMLRYLEQAGLVTSLRSTGGHRLYGPRQIERLQQLRTLIDDFDLGITDIGFEMRMRTEPTWPAGWTSGSEQSTGPAHRPKPASTAG